MNSKTSIAEDIQRCSFNGIFLVALVCRNNFMQPGRADLGRWKRDEHPQLFCPAPAQHHPSGTHASLTVSSNLDAPLLMLYTLHNTATYAALCVAQTAGTQLISVHVLDGSNAQHTCRGALHTTSLHSKAFVIAPGECPGTEHTRLAGKVTKVFRWTDDRWMYRTCESSDHIRRMWVLTTW